MNGCRRRVSTKTRMSIRSRSSRSGEDEDPLEITARLGVASMVRAVRVWVEKS